MKAGILPYNECHDTLEGTVMAKRNVQIKKGEESFGARLARLRQAAGYSQRSLAAEIGISYRMVAYYEGETVYPPAHLLPQLAEALGVSTDQLLGVGKVKKNGRSRDSRLWRRFSQVEKLPNPERKQIVQILDAFLEREKLKKAS